MNNHYDLQAIYEEINQTYFNGELKLTIAWFGNASRTCRRSRKLGLYHFQKKTIQIHRLLDHPDFPHYFISYVVYHEMLHSVHPPIKAKRGRYQIHHGAFKEQEKRFAHYALAKEWEKENKRMFYYGRA